MVTNTIYDPIKDKSLGKNRCFLCGVKLRKSTRTEEHIFPKWLLNMFKLWNQKLSLLNRTQILYNKVKVPCCKGCNTKSLAKLEVKVEKATRGGYRSFCRLPRKILFLWLQKIFYQILYMEFRLVIDRSGKLRGTILTKQDLERFRMSHLFLQSVRIKTKFHKPVPWSIHVFKVQKYPATELNFDFKDNILLHTIAIRMNDIGIVACLQDNRAHQNNFGSHFAKIGKIPLHPVQLDEITAMMFYKTSLLNRTPKYLTMFAKDRLEVISMPLQGMSSKPIYDQSSQEEYAKYLSFYCKIPFADCYQPPDKVWSILYDELHRLRRLNIKTCGF